MCPTHMCAMYCEYMRMFCSNVFASILLNCVALVAVSEVRSITGANAQH